MFRLLVVLTCLVPALARADLDRAITSLDAGDYHGAIALAQDALSLDLPDGKRLLARETLALSEFNLGRTGTAFLEELQALDRDLQRAFGRSAPERLDTLFAISHLQFGLGRIEAATETDLRIALIALAAPGRIDDALLALRNIAVTFEESDPRTALAYAALFEFFAVELLGRDDPVAQEATGMVSLSLFRSGRNARAAQRFLIYTLDSWEAFAAIGPDEAALLDDLLAQIDDLEVADEGAWFAEIQTVIDTELAQEALIADIAELIELGQLDFNSPHYAEALAGMNAYLDLASPDDPVAAVFANMILKSYLEIGDFDNARPYLAFLLSYPVPYVAVLDLPIGTLAGIISIQGGAEDSLFEPLVRTALEIERIVQSDDPEMLFDLSFAHAQMHARLENDERALPSYLAALELAERTDPSLYLNLGPALFGAASVLSNLGRPDEARAHLQRLREHGRTSNDVAAEASALGALSLIALATGEVESALALARERLALETGRAPPDRAAIQAAQFNLATVLLNRADGLSTELVDILSAALSGPTGTDDAQSIRSGLLLAAASRLDATPDTIREHPVFRSADNGQKARLVALLGEAAVGRADIAEARAWVELGQELAAAGSEESLRITEVSGRVMLSEGDTTNALRTFRTISDSRLRPAERQRQGATDHVPYHLAAAFALATDPLYGVDLRFQNEMFLIAQMSNTTSAGDALNAALARSDVDNDVAVLFRQRDTLVRDLEQAGSAIARARYDGSAPGRILEREAELREAYSALTSEIAARAPELARMARSTPLGMADVAARLRDDEVMAVYVTSDAVLPDGSAASYLVALSNDSVFVSQLPGRAELAELSRAFRCSAALTDPNCATGGVGVTRGSFSLQPAASQAGPVFDAGVADQAYKNLIEPMAALLEGRDRLIIVPDQALISVPFHLMLRSPRTPGQSLRDADWLIRHVSIEIAPTVASFAAMRDRTGKRARLDSFLGVGDPLIGRQKNGALPYNCGGAGTEMVLASAAPAALKRSSGADRMSLISDLTELPDARCELRNIAAGFEQSELLLHADATETALKALSAAGALKRYSVLGFATHGLVAGEIGVNDSGLVLTPPRLPTARDDGLLTTAEIAGLELDADIVVLSACNTASGDSLSDEGLSGMASAFFTAGAQSLLVSHWPVYSDAAVTLTTRVFDVLRNDPAVPRAEALRLSMLAILDDPASGPRELHPAYWAPFMIVGDGLGVASR